MITEKKTQFLLDELEQLRQQGLFRPLRVLGSAQDTEVVVDGRHVLNLSSNNYLGLTTHPRLKQAMIEATEHWGAGSGAVRTIAGTMTVQDDLERHLEKHRDKRVKLVVTDGVFSMDGDIAPLAAIVERAERFQALVMVDDAHASGVLGANGRGSVNHFGLDGRVELQIGTLSKAMGVLGGYVAAPQAVRDFLIHRARPFLFSTSHPPGVAAACIAAIEVLLAEPERIERLWKNTARFKDGLKRIGFETGASETPITPVIVGKGSVAMEFSDRLFKLGVFAQGLGFPTVPEGRARIRTIVTSVHTEQQLDRALEAFAKAGKELGVIA